MSDRTPPVFVLVYPRNKRWRASCDVGPLYDSSSAPRFDDFLYASGNSPADALQRLHRKFPNVHYVFISLWFEAT